MISLNLFREMGNLHREMDAIFGGPVQRKVAHRALLPGHNLRHSPRINLSEDADNFYLSALLPGVEAKSLDISLVGNSLTLSGDRCDRELKESRWQRQERTQGKFARRLELPLDVEVESISAEYLDGVLRILIPKAEAAKPRRISIKTKN